MTMECINECGNELTGRQKEFCSDKCRMQFKRNSNKPEQPKVEQQTRTNEQDDLERLAKLAASLPSVSESVRAYNEQPIRTRTTGCKCAIPGDEDYVGVCEKVDGVWRVVPPEPIAVKDMARIELQQAIRAYPNDQWINSPEHEELMHRLHSRSVAELESDGYIVPAWKRSA